MDEEVDDFVLLDLLPEMLLHISCDLVGYLVFAWIGLRKLGIELAVFVVELLN